MESGRNTNTTKQGGGQNPGKTLGQAVDQKSLSRTEGEVYEEPNKIFENCLCV